VAKRSHQPCWDRVQQVVLLLALVTNEAVKLIDALHIR